MQLFQTSSQPPSLPPDTPWWVYLLLASIVPLSGAAARLYTLYRRIAKEKAALLAIRTETLRLAALPLQSVLNRSSVLYIGISEKNIHDMEAAWKTGGMENVLVTVNSPQEGYKHILANPDTIFFVIVYVEDLDVGQQFMDLMAQSSKTEVIPSFGIDGVGPEKKLAAYSMGFRGTLSSPFSIDELTTKLAKLGFLVTLTKV